MPAKRRELKRTRPNAKRVAITFHVSRTEFAAIAAAVTELGVTLEQYCREVESQWRAEWRSQGSQLGEVIEPAPRPRDVLDVASETPPPYRPPRDPAPAPIEEPDDLEPGESDPGDDEEPDEEEEPEPDDHMVRGTHAEARAQLYRRPATGPGPRHISDGRQEEEDDEPPPTVHSVALSPFRKPNPAGIKQRQGKDYGERSPGHDWQAIAAPPKR